MNDAQLKIARLFQTRRSDKIVYLLWLVVIDRIRSFAIKRFVDFFSPQAVVHS